MALRERWQRIVDGTWDDSDLYLDEQEQAIVKWMCVAFMLASGVYATWIRGDWAMFIWGLVTGVLIGAPKRYFE